MNASESQVKAVLSWLAEEITEDSAPPLARPPSPSPAGLGWREPTSRAHGVKWLAPVAAAVSVGVVAAGIVFAASLTGGAHRPSEPAAGDGPEVPPYYFAVSPGSGGRPAQVAVRATRTGARVASVPLRPGWVPIDVSVAADDRTFVVAARQHAGQGVTISLFKFDPAKRRVQLSNAPAPAVPAHHVFAGFALSPNGERLALASMPRHVTGWQLQVFNLRSGGVQTWTSPAGQVYPFSEPLSMRWAADNVTLAINVTAPHPGVCVLRTNIPGNSAGQDCRTVLPLLTGPLAKKVGNAISFPVLTLNGRTMVASATAFPGRRLGGFAQWSARTGRLLRLLDWHPAPLGAGSQADVLWTNATGSVLVVYAPPHHAGRTAILSHGQLTLLPGPAMAIPPIAAW